jgi:hypothetical protein
MAGVVIEDLEEDDRKGEVPGAATIDGSVADQIAAFLAADPRMPAGGADALLDPGAFPSGVEKRIVDVTEALDVINFGLMADVLRASGRGMVPVTREDAFRVGPAPAAATVVSRAQEEEMMRQPVAARGEHPCMAGDNCAAMALKPRGFVAVALPKLDETGNDMREPNFCVFCCRVLMNRLILKSLVSDEPPIQVNYANMAGVPGEYDISQCLFTTEATRQGVFAPVANHCVRWYATEFNGEHLLVARQTGYKQVNFLSGALPS